uniref:Uncharacterized protein n=1 Tax=Physcomitrium patens TaxID=3218 RepID=A0A2K1J6N5_PHYPA|nr:hypothetical protein PHYPA_020297 [Physcomitrium patens]
MCGNCDATAIRVLCIVARCASVGSDPIFMVLVFLGLYGVVSGTEEVIVVAEGK